MRDRRRRKERRIGGKEVEEGEETHPIPGVCLPRVEAETRRGEEKDGRQEGGGAEEEG